jgi:hypothetical protein
MNTPARHRVALALIIAGGLATCLTLAQQLPLPPPRDPKADALKREKAIAALQQPWPDAETIKKHRVDAEKRRLFQSDVPLNFTLRANFKAVNRDRNPNSKVSYPATLIVADESGAQQEIQVLLRTRGSLRLRVTTCEFPPIRVEFPKTGLKGTPFAGQASLKLVPHCVDNAPFEQFILRELLAYKFFNLFTPYSYRVRQAKGTYVDAASGKVATTRYAFFVESDEDVARRVEGRVADLVGQRFAGLDDDTLVRMTMMQWMVGNTDYSIANLHNVRLIQRLDGMRYPVAYDFDSTGVVDPPYAGPDKRLGITSLRDRLFRGPCRPMERYEVFFAKFREKKGELMALIDAVPGMTDGSKRDVRSFMNDFYNTIGNPGRAKKAMLDSCLNSTRM